MTDEGPIPSGLVQLVTSGFEGIRVDDWRVVDGDRVISLYDATALVARGADLGRTMRRSARAATFSHVLGGPALELPPDTLQLIVITPSGLCLTREVRPEQELQARRFAAALNAARTEHQKRCWAAMAEDDWR